MAKEERREDDKKEKKSQSCEKDGQGKRRVHPAALQSREIPSGPVKEGKSEASPQVGTGVVTRSAGREGRWWWPSSPC